MHDRPARRGGPPSRTSLVLPQAIVAAVLFCLEQVARGLIALRVTANGITLFSVALAPVAAVLLALGHFGLAAAAMVIASLGDALDGLVARRSGTASVGGALLDASVDRYEEFFFLGGLAVFFRASPPALVLTLFALAGSFMVSYGSAKAEGLGLPVPPGPMRRAERAVCLCVGSLLVTPCDWVARGIHGAESLRLVPLLLALAIVAVVANGSAIRRLQALARARAAPMLAVAPPTETEAKANRSSFPGPVHDLRAQADEASKAAPHVVGA